MKYVRKSGARLELYEDKHCVECDQTHAIKVNEAHCSSKAVDAKLQAYKERGYQIIETFQQLDEITKECAGPEEEDD